MNKQILITAAAALIIGALGGYWLSAGGMTGQTAVTQKAPEAKPIFYRNPMNPEVTSPVPAKDEMGMDYIPVYAAGTRPDEPSGTVRIDPVTSQNMGVRSVRVERKVLTKNISAVGHLDYDEKRITKLHPKVEGWVEELFVDTTGAKVAKDTMLLSLYSPQLVSSEEEYLLALKNAKLLKGSSQPDIREGAQRLAAASLERLKLFDVPAHQIEALEKDGRIIKNMHIHSPFDGIVISIGVRKGQYVTPAMELYTIANLSRIWVYVDIYEDEISWVSVGDTAKMTVTGVPGRQFTGTVSYIYPYLDAATRTNIVRLEFDNQDLALKPEMFAHVTLMTGKKVEAVVAPNEAIIRTGGQEQVFVVKGDGKFEPRKVTLGISTGKEVQILSGLQAGEIVVTSAQFLIDSESKLNEASAKMMAPVSEQTPSPTPAGEMNGMDMGGHDHMQMNTDQKPAAMDGMDMQGHDHMKMGGHDHMKMEAAPEEKKQ